MPTNWVVTTPSDHVELDETSQGQTTFTVTNPTKRVDRVMVDIVVGDGADASWFTIEEPQRRVPASGSVSYLMKTAVPATAKPGSYNVQARVYSADSAPEEDSVLSNRVVLEIKAKPAPVVVKKKIPWWVFVVIALVVIVAVVVAIIANSGGTPKPTPSTGPTGTVTMPDLNKQSEAQARTNLTAFGLTVGKVLHKFDPTGDQVLYQSVAGGAVVAKGTAVDLVVTVAGVAPTIVAVPGPVPLAVVRPKTTPVPVTPAGPAPSASASAPAASPTASGTAAPPAPKGLLNWNDPQTFTKHWIVNISEQYCLTPSPNPANPFLPLPPRTCWVSPAFSVVVDQPTYTPLLSPPARFNQPGGGIDAMPNFLWTVTAVDDFGNVGPQSAAGGLTVQ